VLRRPSLVMNRHREFFPTGAPIFIVVFVFVFVALTPTKDILLLLLRIFLILVHVNVFVIERILVVVCRESFDGIKIFFESSLAKVSGNQILSMFHIVSLVNYSRGNIAALTVSLILIPFACVESVLRALCNSCVALMRIEMSFSASLPRQNNLSGLHSIVFSLSQLCQSLELFSAMRIVFGS